MDATQSLQSIQTRRRIILSGTPIQVRTGHERALPPPVMHGSSLTAPCPVCPCIVQNDLGEFFAMVDFVNPGLMKDYATFRKVFEEPILASRQSNSTPAEVAIGQARSAEVRTSRSRRCTKTRSMLKNKKGAMGVHSWRA